MIDIFKDSLAQKEHHALVILGILLKTCQEIQNKLHNWRYFEGKKRVEGGKTYNLKGVVVDYSIYSMSISVKSYFLLDVSHVKKQEKIDSLNDIDNWLGWKPSNIPPNISKYKDLYLTEEKEMKLEEILIHGYLDLEVV